MSYIERQIELRNRAWEEAKALLDAAAAEKRDLSAEEEQKYQRINDDLNKRSETIKQLQADEARELHIAEATRGKRTVEETREVQNDADNRSSFGKAGPGQLPPPSRFAPDATTQDVIALVKQRFV